MGFKTVAPAEPRTHADGRDAGSAAVARRPGRAEVPSARGRDIGHAARVGADASADGIRVRDITLLLATRTERASWVGVVLELLFSTWFGSVNVSLEVRRSDEVLACQDFRTRSDAAQARRALAAHLAQLSDDEWHSITDWQSLIAQPPVVE